MNETYAFIEAEKTTHGVAFLCRLLNVARSSFYAWQAAAKARAARQAADEALAHEITVIHVASRHTYGIPRIHAELRRLGRAVNRKRVARVMRERGFQGAHRRRRRSLTRPGKKARPAPDLIGRDFHAERPGTKLVGDITCLPTAEGRLYLACWLDLATCEIVGYAMAAHHRASLVVDALRMAHGRGGLQPGCITHSDRGSDWLNPANTHQQSSAVKYVSWACDKAAAAPDHASTMPPRKASGPCSRKRSAPAPGPTGPPPAPRSSLSSRRSTTGAAYANTRSSATSPRPRPGSATSTPLRHRDRVSKITGKLQVPDLSDRVHRPVQPVVAAPVQPVHVGQARRGRIGATPAKDAKAASERNRPGGDQLTRI